MKMFKINKLWFVTLCTVFLYGLGVAPAVAKDYPFSWSANADPVQGYKLYYKKAGSAGPPFAGTDASEGVSPIDLGKVTSFTITGLADNTTYHFALAAYNGSEESDLTDVITVFPELTPLAANVSVNSQTGEAPFTVNFNGSGSTGSIATYSWVFGNGSVASGSSASSTYQNSGTYTAMLTVSDATGLIEQTSIVVTVVEPPPSDPPVAAMSASNVLGEAPLSVNFDAEGSTSVVPPISTYSWAFGDNSTGGGASVDHVYNQAGVYIATLTVEDKNGVSEQVNITITVVKPTPSDPPVAAMSASVVSGEAPLSVNFDAEGSTSVVPPISAYSWDFGDNSTGGGASVDHVYNQAGVYTAVLTVADKNGVSEQVNITITVVAVPLPDPPVASLSASVSTGPVALNVTFSGSRSTGTISSYSWDFGDSSGGSGESVSHIYDEVGSYTVILTVADAVGQTSQQSVVITAVAGGASYPFSWTANAEPVEGYRLYYKKGGSAGPPFDGIDASEGVSPIDLGKVTSFTITGLADNTTYHFALAAYNGSEESDLTDVITVFPELTPLVANVSVNSQTGEAPLTVNFNGSASTGSIATYSWVFGNGSVASGSSASSTYQNSGTYTAMLTVSDATGLIEQTSIVVTVVEPPPSDPPVAALSASIVLGEAPLAVNFDAEGSTSVVPPISTYSWAFGDNSTGGGASVDHVYNQAGVYVATLTVEDKNGVSEEVNITITVVKPPPSDPPVAAMSASVVSGEAPLSVNFDAEGSTSVVPPISAYSWDFGDNSTGGGAAVDHVYNQAGVYTAVLTVEDKNGVSKEVNITITVVAVPLPDPPVASLSASVSTGPVALNVTFSGSRSTGTISSYSWDFGDSSGGSGESVSHIYDEVGSYTVILTVADAAGQTSRKSVVITAVAGGASYPFSWTANAEPVEGYRLYYKKGGSAGPPFDGTDASEGVSPIDLGKVTSFTITGLADNTTYHFALTAYNGSEESDLTDVITVFPELTPLAANVSVNSQTGEAPLTVNFNGSASTGSIATYSWVFGNGSVASGSSASSTYQNSGTYTAMLTVSDGAGLIEQTSIVVTVVEPPPSDPPVAAMSASIVLGEAPLSVNFDAEGSTSVVPPISTYSWAFGDNSTGGGASVDHVYNQAGVYIATLTVEDKNGVSEQVNITITVVEPPPSDPPVAAMSASVVSGEAPLSVNFDAEGSTSVVPPISAYSWDFGDNSTGGGASVDHVYNQAGVYTAVLTVADKNGVSEQVNITITVVAVPLPDPPVASLSASVSTGPVALNVTFSGSRSTGTISAYSWDFGDSSGGSGESVSHVYDEVGSYTVILTVADAVGQTSQQSVVITAVAGGASYPFSWTANAEPVEGYRLYYKKGGSAGPPFDGTDASEGVSPIDLGKVTSFTITGLADNTTYHFALAAYNGSEESDLTDVITVFPELTPLAANVSVNSQTGEAPLTVNFNGSASTGSITKYSWVFGDGSVGADSGTGSGASVSHVYKQPGFYSATLTVEDNTGVLKEVSVTITVSEPPPSDPPVAAMSASIVLGEAPLSVNFDAEGSTSVVPPISTYSWAFGDNSTGGGASVDHVYNQAGVYVATLTVEDKNGVSEQVNITITVVKPPPSDPPVAAMSASVVSGEAPLSVNFDAEGSISVVPPISAYSWDFGDNNTGGGASVDHVYNQAGVYTAVLTVEDKNGVSKEVNITITVVAVPLPDPLVAGLSASVSTGPVSLNVTFSGSGSTGAISAYSWDFGDSSSGSGESVNHVYDTVGSYTVILTVAGTAGETSQKSVVITAVAGVSYPFSWTANAEPVEGYRLYYKKGGSAGPPFDGTDASEGVSPIDLGKVTSFTITGLADNTTYHFALAAYNGSEESDLTDVITVFPELMPLAANVIVNSQTGQAPLTVNFNGSGSTGSISSYSWNFGDGSTATGPEVNHSYRSVGEYTATLNVVDANGSSRKDSIDINVTATTRMDAMPPTAIAEVDSSEGFVSFVAVFKGGRSTCAANNTIVAYEWDFGDGSEKRYGATVEHFFSQVGTYLVVLKVTDSSGNSAETIVSVRANAPVGGDNTAPMAVFAQTATVGAVPFSVEFNASRSSDSDGDTLRYSWTFGDGAVASGVVVEHTYANTGVFSVRLIVEDGRGADSEVSQEIVVLTVGEYETYLRGEKVKKVINIINTFLLLDD